VQTSDQASTALPSEGMSTEGTAIENIATEQIMQAWSQQNHSPLFFKEVIADFQQSQFKHFENGADVNQLINSFSLFIDKVLTCLWQHHQLDQDDNLSLIAVGGYGRQELHPQSDVDILVLKKTSRYKKADEQITQFITQLWDLGLDIGSSVRSIKDCFKEAKADITIATNIIEARTLCGSSVLLKKMQHETRPKKIWNSVAFFSAKRKEQKERHNKNNNTEYNLEPDIKEAPGGLRDIQMISWVAKRHYNCDSLYALVEHGFIEESEYDSLVKCQDFLWKIRYALHGLLGRSENKLLFDHQKMLAKHFGYKDTKKSLAIEQFMKQYYRVAIEVAELNDMLLQHFDDHIINKTRLKRTIKINNDFKLRKGYLETINDRVFLEKPSALLEVFVISAKNKNVEDIHIRTIRQIRKYRHLINDDFRNDKRNTALFIELLNSPYNLFSQLKRMKRYGVLGAYIPEFEAIIGQMQYDLFHIYTVDAHTLLLIKNLRRFRHKDIREEFPIAYNIVHTLPKLAPLYIAGIFHDIGKGSGRDHSELGAELVIPFMEMHGYSQWDTELVSWLVKSHLLMSITTQRKDLADPEVIQGFAAYVGNPLRLDYLYVLTVADVNATNPTLWNGWKASLYRELYTKTKQLFRTGSIASDNMSLIEDRKSEAESLIKSQALCQDLSQTQSQEQCQKLCKELWDSLDDEYFIRHNALEIVWQSELIIKHQSDQPLISVRTENKKHLAQTFIFTYTKDSSNLFAATVTLLNKLGLSVIDARIMSTSNSMALNTYVVLDENTLEAPNTEQYKDIIKVLNKGLADPKEFPNIVKNGGNKKLSRQIKQFTLKTQAHIRQTEHAKHSIVEVRTLDRPGLLANIGAIFMEFNLILHNARITTLGETVEDVFFVSTPEGLPLDEEKACNDLTQHIEHTLDQVFLQSSDPQATTHLTT